MVVDLQSKIKTAERKLKFYIFLYVKFNVIIFELNLGMNSHLAIS